MARYGYQQAAWFMAAAMIAGGCMGAMVVALRG